MTAAEHAHTTSGPPYARQWGLASHGRSLPLNPHGPPDHVEGHELICEARAEHLRAILDFLQSACRCAGVDPDATAELSLAVEEVCVNVIRHGYAGRRPGPIRIAFRAEADRVEVSIADEASPFDPAAVPPPDLSSGWADRPIGGLGWHLIRNSVDEVRHEAVPGGGNLVTLVKTRQPANPPPPLSLRHPPPA